MYEMPESERNRLIKLRRALLLAVSDMEQAIRAAQVLVLEEDDGRLARALETAISVTYMRPFTQGSLGQLPAEYVPNAGGGEDVHAKLKDLRDKVYAHTDEESGRYAFVTATARQGNTVTIDFRESWLPLPREVLPTLVMHFERQRDRFRTEAASVHVQLHGLGGLR